MRGLRVSVHGMLYVREQQIMTLDGEWHRLRFGKRGGGMRSRTRMLGASMLSLHEVLARGGTRPGYDHDDVE